MYGNGADCAKGRQMPVHFTFTDPIKFFSISSPIGTHIVQAVGAAYAMQYRKEKHAVLASFGDGGTSSLGFHSGLNFAGVWKSPVVFLCLFDCIRLRHPWAWHLVVGVLIGMSFGPLLLVALS